MTYYSSNRPIRLLLSIALLLMMGVSLILSADLDNARAQEREQYIVLGDSIPAGLTSTLPRIRSFPVVLGRYIEDFAAKSGSLPVSVDIQNVATPGETTESFFADGQYDEFLTHIDESVANETAVRLITLTLGGNDALSLRRMSSAEREEQFSRFEDAYPDVLEAVREQGERVEAQIVVTTYYDLSEGDKESQGSDAWWLERFNNVIRNAAAERDIAVADIESAFSGRISELTWYPADVHPNNAGHHIYADTIWKTLESDSETPAIIIERPTQLASQSRVITVHASVNDPGGITHVELVDENNLVQQMLYRTELDRYVGVWDGRQFEGDVANLQVIAHDRAGNVTAEPLRVGLPSD